MATYPFTRFKYKVEIPGIGAVGFSEVTGFDASIDVVEYRNGTDLPSTPLKLPGLRKYSNVTLKWGATDNKEIFDWLDGWLQKDGVRKDISVTLLDDEGKGKASWVIIAAWPMKYTAPEFSATSSEVAIESIAIAHEGMKRTQ